MPRPTYTPEQRRALMDAWVERAVTGIVDKLLAGDPETLAAAGLTDLPVLQAAEQAAKDVA